MLKKLLKYDLENVFKVLVIFYSLALLFGLFTRIFLNSSHSFILNVIGQICSTVTVSMMISILINNLMRLWVRFKNNFYGDESYLTHTLPIEKKTLYLSKILTAILSLFTSVLVIVLTILIAYSSKEFIENLKELLFPIASMYNSTILKLVLAFVFIFFLEFANTLQSGYTGIILGHKMNNTKTAFSVLYGFISYSFIQTITVVIMFLVALFNKEIMNLFITNQPISIEVAKVFVYMAMAIYTVTFIIGYIVNIRLFKKGVNVD